MDPVCHDETHNMTFTFRVLPPPPLSFAPSPAPSTPPSNPLQEPPYPRKRARPLADIDGLDFDIRDYTKKRRLRLKLITSRLSEPFAVPPTNILERGNCPRVALWAKTRCVARSALRKAAILNKIKRDAMAAREAHERQVEAARRQFRSVQIIVAPSQSRSANFGSRKSRYPDDDASCRERLAAAAHASFQRSNVVRYHRPVDRRRTPPPLPRQETPRSPSPSPASSFAALQISKPRSSSRGKGMQRRDTVFIAGGSRRLMVSPDPYNDLPAYRRPPSPPSESELNRQRRGMGLDIGCC
jgi:hypothetical protein